VAAVAAAPDEEPVLALRRDFAGRHVLVAEDDPLNREVATSLLESAGLVPLLAGTGAEAVALVARGDCDAVLMDVHMPGMNGLDATRAIRKLPGMAALPIIAMTASAFDEERALVPGGRHERPHRQARGTRRIPSLPAGMAATRVLKHARSRRR
jgi:CheY-like chemotaxis protein